jgi:hypothetical protein
VQNERAAESNFGLAVRKGNRISHGWLQSNPGKSASALFFFAQCSA